MTETYLLNLGSLVFGLIAWILPVIFLIQRKKSSNAKYSIFSAASIIACSISLCLQIFELNHRVTIQDWSALLDTSNTVATVAGVLLAVTAILNAITLAGHAKRHLKA